MGHLNILCLQSGDQKIASRGVKTGREKVESFNVGRTADPAFPELKVPWRSLASMDASPADPAMVSTLIFVIVIKSLSDTDSSG